MQISYLRIGIFASVVFASVLVGCSSDDTSSGPTCDAPALPTALPDGAVDVPYDLAGALDAFRPVEASPPPPGLDSRLTGTPTAAGTYEVTVSIMSSGGACNATTASRKLTLVVAESPAVCDEDVDCAFLHSALGGGECKTDSQCSGGHSCIRLVDTGVCHKNEPGILCGSGTRRLQTETMTGRLVETCVSDIERRKACNERSHCVDVPLLSKGNRCSADIQCASRRCDPFDTCE